MTETVISTIAGIISGILAGTISSRVYVRKYTSRSQDTQTFTNSPGAKHDDQGQTVHDVGGFNMRDNFGPYQSPDNRSGDMRNRSQNASTTSGDAFNFGGDQNNWRS